MARNSRRKAAQMLLQSRCAEPLAMVKWSTPKTICTVLILGKT